MYDVCLQVMPQAPRSKFLSLPLELRYIIYDLLLPVTKRCFTEDEYNNVNLPGQSPSGVPHILKVIGPDPLLPLRDLQLYPLLQCCCQTLSEVVSILRGHKIMNRENKLCWRLHITAYENSIYLAWSDLPGFLRFIPELEISVVLLETEHSVGDWKKRFTLLLLAMEYLLRWGPACEASDPPDTERGVRIGRLCLQVGYQHRQRRKTKYEPLPEARLSQRERKALLRSFLSDVESSQLLMSRVREFHLVEGRRKSFMSFNRHGLSKTTFVDESEVVNQQVVILE